MRGLRCHFPAFFLFLVVEWTIIGEVKGGQSCSRDSECNYNGCSNVGLRMYTLSERLLWNHQWRVVFCVPRES